MNQSDLLVVYVLRWNHKMPSLFTILFFLSTYNLFEGILGNHKFRSSNIYYPFPIVCYSPEKERNKPEEEDPHWKWKTKLWIQNIREVLSKKDLVFSQNLFLFFYSFFPHICNAFRPFLPLLSVLVAAICAGAALALNVECIKSPLGVSLLSPVNCHLL